MIQFLDDMIIGFKCRAVKAAERFEEESGVSSFVATILLIVIVVALTAIFWKYISQWFEDTWQSITGKASEVGATSEGP